MTTRLYRLLLFKRPICKGFDNVVTHAADRFLYCRSQSHSWGCCGLSWQTRPRAGWFWSLNFPLTSRGGSSRAGLRQIVGEACPAAAHAIPILQINRGLQPPELSVWHLLHMLHYTYKITSFNMYLQFFKAN